MKITGGCHCGNIHYSAEIDPNKVILCHCTDCQKMSGSPYRGVVIATDETFQMTGQIKDYIKETANSGNPRAQSFCPDCGTHIYATSTGEMPEGTPRVYNIRLGTTQQRDELTPTIEIWANSRQPWIDAVEGAAQIPEQP
ncbi:MAG: GFA family protein [Arenicella sp.]